MTNQMKIILKVGLCASLGAFVTSVVAFIVGGVGYLNPFSYVLLGFSAVTTIVLFIMYLNMKSDERMFKQRIAYFKLLQELRNKAILDFYNKFGIKPQYNKEGKLLTPDEFLGIITKLDAEGNLDPSVYEQLGILPRFDENGKEIPTILVLKHLIRTIKKQGLSDIKKLKGLYAKGTRVKASAEKDNKTKGKDAKAKEKAKTKDKKKEKSGKLTGKVVKPKPSGKKKGPEKKDKPKEKKGEEKPKENPAEKKAPTHPPKENTPPPRIEKVTPEEIGRVGDEYFDRLGRRPQSPPPVVPKSPARAPRESEIGECTPE